MRSPGEQRFAVAASRIPVPGRREEEHFGLGAEDLRQPLQAALVHRLEVRPAVVDDRLRHGREHFGRDRSRARGEQITLLGQALLVQASRRLDCRPPRVRGRCSPAAQRRARGEVAGTAPTRAGRLECRARLLRDRGGCSGLGRRGRLERACVSRLLPVRRAAHGSAARSGVHAPLRLALDALPRPRLRRPGDRGRHRRADPRRHLRDEHPEAQEHLGFLPARLVAILGNSVGTSPSSVWRLPIRRRPLGNVLIITGVAVAALGSAFAGLGAAERCFCGNCSTSSLRRF